MEAACAVCGNSTGNAVHEVREMHFGTGEQFHYVECAACGTLTLLDVPSDLGKYYPKEYYSLSVPDVPRVSPLLRRLKAQRTKYVLTGRGWLGKLIAQRTGVPVELLWLAGLGLSLDSRILDVGCGTGGLLLAYQAMGLRNLVGADPFIEASIQYPGGLTIHKVTLGELAAGPDCQQSFDLVTLHHSLEHMADPREVLAQLRHLVKQGGHVLIRTPVAGCTVWRQYGTDWVQLDAPRHLCIASERGLRKLAEEEQFTVERVEYDSSAFQFWGSEQYRRGIALNSRQSYHRDPAASPFSAEQIAEWEAEAQRLNASGEGDQALYVLRSTSNI